MILPNPAMDFDPLDVLTAAELDDLVENDQAIASGLNDGTALTSIRKNNLTIDSNPYKFSAYLTAAQNVGTGATTVLFNVENFDTNNNFDITTNKGRYTAPVSGFYQFNTNVVTTSAGTGTLIGLLFYKNGTTITNLINSIANAGSNPGASLSALIQLTAGDYLEVQVGSGVAAKALDVANNAFNTFSGFLVSRT